MTGERFTEDEGRTFAELLRRYCELELDQFDFLRIDTSHGPVYIDFKRRLLGDVPHDAYRTLPPPSSTPD